MVRSRGVNPYARRSGEHGGCHQDDGGEHPSGQLVAPRESMTSDGDPESGPDFSWFSEEPELGGLRPSRPLG